MPNMLSCWACVACIALAAGCGADLAPNPSEPAAPAGSGGSNAAASAGVAAGSSGAAGGRRSSPLDCAPHSGPPVTCGGQACPNEYPMQSSSCFEACCLTFEGRERCGLRGNAAAFRTECVLPGEPDDSCDEIVQFQGCCDLTQHRCGIIGGFAPGCQTKSTFVTLPKNPKTCGGPDADAGTIDAG
jgi:hypothetical protein